MNTSKPASIISSVILIVLLVGACGTLPPERGSNETVTSAPTFTPVPSTVTQTPTPEFVTVPATVMPTQPPPPILTPDAIQVERWKEYQTEFAKVLLSFDPEHPEGYDPDEYKDALCEWDILGQSGQEMYIWVVCNSADGLSLKMKPALIYLNPDGSIEEVNIPKEETDSNSQLAIYDLHLFPIDVQEKLCLYYFGWVPQCNSVVTDYVPSLSLQPRVSELISHLEYRLTHLEEPPLVFLPTMLASTPTP